METASTAGCMKVYIENFHGRPCMQCLRIGAGVQTHSWETTISCEGDLWCTKC